MQFEEQFPRPFGPYALLGELGRGTTGIVCKAEYLRTGRIQAIKFPTDGRSARALMEMRVLAYLGPNVPGVVKIYDVAEIDARFHFGREYVDGSDLATHLETDRPSIAVVTGLLASVARTVQLIHDSGFRHGNLAPENVLIPRKGDPKLIGFGQTVYARSIVRPDAHAFDSDVQALGKLLLTAADRIGEPLPEVLEAITMKCEAAGSNWGYRSADHVADDLDRYLDG